MIKVIPLFDAEHAEVLLSIILADGVFEYFSDGSKTKQEAAVAFSDDLNNPNVLKIGVFDDQELIGCFIMHPWNQILWQIHIAFLPGHQGKKVKEAIEQLKEMLHGTHIKHIITQTPGDLRHVSLFARRMGMKQYAEIPKAFERDGKLHSLKIFGIFIGEE